MREQRTKAQVEKKKQKQKQKLQDNTQSLSPLPHPVINQPPPQLTHAQVVSFESLV